MKELSGEQTSRIMNLCERSFTGMVIISDAAVKEYLKITNNEISKDTARSNIRNLYKRGQNEGY